jgi:hypothetical protein
MTLPRLAFEMVSIQYDPTRKASVTQSFKAVDGNNKKFFYLYLITLDFNLI